MKHKTCRYCNTPHVLLATTCMFCREPFKQQLAARIWNRVLNENFRRVIRVKSLRPYWAEGQMWWPCLLVDDQNRSRVTVTPGWNLARIKNVLRGSNA
jgi:hypothetical protein